MAAKNIKLSKNFTYDEMIHSATAKRLNIDNTPNARELENLRVLCQTVLQPIRDKRGSAITVTSGYRCPKLNALVGGSKTSQHCFDQNTEILTNNGWKKIKTINTWDKPYTYNIEKECIELDEIKDIIVRPFDGNLYYASNKHVEYAVTDEHRMLVRYTPNKYERTTDRVLSEREQEYFDSLKTDNDKYHIELAKDVHKKRRHFKCAANSSFKNEYDIDILRLCMATISDGFITMRGGKFHGIGFNLVKERDKNELEDILAKLNIHYTKILSKSHMKLGKDNVYSYFVNSKNSKEVYQIIGKEKKIPRWFLSLSPDILKQLVICYAKFDGTLDERENCHGITIFSKDEDNIDMLQTMCIFSNMRCIKKTIKNEEIHIGDLHNVIPKFYKLYITTSSNESRMNETNYRRFYYKGDVWCLTTNNGTLITRRNGKVSIQGNCLGQAADITLGNPTLNKKLFNMIVDMINKKEIRVGQLIDEYNYRWLHISTPYSKVNNIIHIK